MWGSIARNDSVAGTRGRDKHEFSYVLIPSVYPHHRLYITEGADDGDVIDEVIGQEHLTDLRSFHDSDDEQGHIVSTECAYRKCMSL